MSVFHRVDDIDSMPIAALAPRMVRLPAYGGAVAFAARQAQQDMQPSPVQQRPSQAPGRDITEAMASDPLFMKLGTVTKVPPPSD